MQRQNNETRKGKRKIWVRKLYEERKLKGEYQLLIHDLRLHDHEIFFRYFRILPETYKILLNLVADDIKKLSTNMREPIGPD